MTRKVITKAVIWFFFTVLLGEGLPMLFVALLSITCGIPVRDALLAYVGRATPQLIAFGILMAVAGDRLIDRGGLRSLLRGPSLLVFLLVASHLLIALYLQYFVKDVPTGIVLLLAIPAVIMILAASAMKHRDWRQAASDARITSATLDFTSGAGI